MDAACGVFALWTVACHAAAFGGGSLTSAMLGFAVLGVLCLAGLFSPWGRRRGGSDAPPPEPAPPRPLWLRALGVARERRGALSDEVLAFLERCFARDEVEANGQPFLFRPRPPKPPILCDKDIKTLLRRSSQDLREKRYPVPRTVCT